MSHNMRRSTQVALGGMIAALSLLFLFLTGVFPFATYILPAAAGILLVAVVVESGWRWALGVYAAVSLLAVFIAPVRGNENSQQGNCGHVSGLFRVLPGAQGVFGAAALPFFRVVLEICSV